jgi:hypothetical protein
MDIHIPAAPAKQAKGVTLIRVSARWRKRVAYVKYVLEQAGVPIVPVTPPAVPGVRMRDLLAFERSIRQQEASKKNQSLKSR